MDTAKIGVLTCRKVGLTCTGAGCFKTFENREKAFERYKDQDVRIAAFFDCSGCDADKMTDPGFTKKMRRIKENNIGTVHIAHCILSDCPHLEEIKAALAANEIPIVEGTH